MQLKQCKDIKMVKGEMHEWHERWTWRVKTFNKFASGKNLVHSIDLVVYLLNTWILHETYYYPSHPLQVYTSLVWPRLTNFNIYNFHQTSCKGKWWFIHQPSLTYFQFFNKNISFQKLYVRVRHIYHVSLVLKWK